MATAALLLTAACGHQATVAPATPAKPSPTGSPTAVDSAPPDQQSLDTAANAINGLGASHQASFTGLAVDDPGDRVIVYRKRDPGFDAALARLHTGVHVDVRDAPRSISELQATRSAATALMGHTTGYTIVSLGDGSEESWAKGVVEVGVTGDLGQAKRELGARFGDRVTVSAAEPVAG
jgi:hypothetical protein